MLYFGVIYIKYKIIFFYLVPCKQANIRANILISEIITTIPFRRHITRNFRNKMLQIYYKENTIGCILELHF